MSNRLPTHASVLRNQSTTLWIMAVALVIALGLRPSLHAEDAPKKPVVVRITQPVNGGYVGMLHKVHGQLAMRGQPIVVVRVKSPGAHWWVQEPSLSVGAGRFMARVQFGNTETLDGVQFEVRALLATTPQQAAPFKVGKSFAFLPLEMAKSPVVVVTRGLPPQGDGPEAINFAIPQDAGEPKPPMAAGLGGPIALGVDVPAGANGQAAGNAPADAGGDSSGIITTPSSNAEVDKIFELKGKAPVATHPIVMLRPNIDKAAWRVVDRPQVDPANGEFTAKIRCGNDRTAPGTEFRFIVLLPITNEQLRRYPLGKVVKTTPIGVQASDEIVVKRRGS